MWTDGDGGGLGQEVAAVLPRVAGDRVDVTLKKDKAVESLFWMHRTFRTVLP